MILCITPNPAIDRTLVIPNFKTETINRSAESLIAAGGKGLNMARAALTLDSQVRCAGLLGSFSGQNLAHLAQQAGLQSDWTWIEGETRTCTIIVDTPNDKVTVINEAGPLVSGEEWRRFEMDVVQVAQSAFTICISGSLPVDSSQAAFANCLEQSFVENPP